MPTDADRIADYKGFTIRIFKTANGSWRAIITKVDGSKIKAAGRTSRLIQFLSNLIALTATKRLKKRSG